MSCLVTGAAEDDDRLKGSMNKFKQSIIVLMPPEGTLFARKNYAYSDLVM